MKRDLAAIISIVLVAILGFILSAWIGFMVGKELMYRRLESLFLACVGIDGF